MSPRDPSKTRARLVETAAALFYRHGIHRTNLDAVVAEAGLTKPTLYRHFASKDELVAAVVSLRSENWHRAIDQRVTAARSPRKRLMAVFDFLDEFIGAGNFRGCALVNASVEVVNPANPGRKIAAQNKRENRLRFERIAREAGLRQPKSLAAALSLLFEGAIVQAYVESDPNAGRHARQAAEQLIRSRGG